MIGWIQLVQWIQSQDTLTIIIALGITCYLIYKGIIQIPGINNKLKRSKGNPHINCRNYKDLEIRLSRLMIVKTEIDRLINIEILKEQMNYIDQIVYNIRKKLERHFDILLKKEKPNIENINVSKEHISFENLTKIIEHTIKDIMRFAMKENHIPQKEAEFILYANIKIDHIIQHIEEDLNVNWHSGIGIPKHIHSESLCGSVPGVFNVKTDIKEILLNTFRKCREIYDMKWQEAVKYDNEAAALFPEIYKKATKKEGEE